jgi:hypothetical protein
MGRRVQKTQSIASLLLCLIIRNYVIASGLLCRVELRSNLVVINSRHACEELLRRSCAQFLLAPRNDMVCQYKRCTYASTFMPYYQLLSF